MKPTISDPSKNVTEVHIPRPTEFEARFVYNFYSVDERTTPSTGDKNVLENIPRYVKLSWTTPKLSTHELQKGSTLRGLENAMTPLADNQDKIVREDNFFNRGYLSYTFSDIDAIAQGANDLENYSRINDPPTESVFEMAQTRVKELITDGVGLDELYASQIPSFIDAYQHLADFPKDSLGLRVFDQSGRQIDKDDLMRTISNNLSLNVRVNHTVLQDVFKNSSLKSKTDGIKSLSSRLKSSLARYNDNKSGDVYVLPVSESETYMPNDRPPIKIMGYAIDRYLSMPDRFTKERTFYVENALVSEFYDTEVLYGLTYVYTIRTITSVNILSQDDTDVKPTVLELFVSSRPTSTPVECFEYTPPPHPTNLSFTYDYNRSALVIVWDTPLNTQLDIKQFQVFRRSTIDAPFELIAQYCFDKSYPGKFGESKYTTGEIVDGNSSDVPPEYAYLLRTTESTAFRHIDEDFVVDTEFLESPTYIYSVCAIDAHGMVSAYSEQKMVTFDQYKNRLVVTLVAEAGAPRPYPNMTLKLDAFKDTLRVEGVDTRSMAVHFNPDFLTVADDNGTQHKIVEAQSFAHPDEKPYYLMQIINLDNQKTQILKIVVKDPRNLTVAPPRPLRENLRAERIFLTTE
jgi:hypothetical protein